MQFDLFTFAATIVNFLVLVVLLRVFLYKRVLGAIDDREQKIRDRWENAEREKKEAEKSALEYREKSQEIEDERNNVLADAREEAEERKRELIEEAKDDVSRRKEQWLASLEEERKRFLSEFRKAAADQLVSVLDDILEDLADESLQKRIVSRFASMMRELGQEDRDALSQAIEATDGPVRVRSSHNLTDKEQEEVRKAVESVAEAAQLQFETDPDLVAGIEVLTPERRVSFSIRDYLDQVGNTLSESLAGARE